MRDDIREWLTLANCQGVGALALRRLVEKFGTPGNVLRAPRIDHVQTDGIGPEAAAGIARADGAFADAQVRAAELHGVGLVTLADDAYPPRLRETAAPPPILSFRGDLALLAGPTVAMVGARQLTDYGRHVARMFAEELARRGVCVVSGMALGIDACAHEGALRGGGPTAAVLGTGLDHPYPATNRRLFDRICASGVVISEFPLGTRADPVNFPRRNATISGVSQGVVVVEAGPGSGSLLTAQYAAEQGREVFGIPGPVTSPKSLGPHELIREGATLAQSPESILVELGIAPRPTGHAPRLSGVEGEILACLTPGTGTHVDAIAESVGMPPHEVLGILLSLELGSHVTQMPGKRFALTN